MSSSTTSEHPFLPILTSIVKTVIDNTSSSENKQEQQQFVTPEEVKWMHSKRNFTKPFASEKEAVETLTRDYGESEAKAILENFTTSGEQGKLHLLLLPLLRWSGIGTRHRSFLSWFKQTEPSKKWLEKLLSSSTSSSTSENNNNNITNNNNNSETILLDIFHNFANHLGRVTTYRALALDKTALKNIFDADSIFPTGQLHFSPQDLQQVVEEHGIRKVLVARLFIAHLKRLIGKDPSVSLHDDWATTSIIASGYFTTDNNNKNNDDEDKSVYLFEVNVPVILSCGWTLAEVGSFGEEFLGPQYRNHPPWFCFRSPATTGNGGCWFDATLLRTERYTFYGVPFLQKCLKRMFCFESVEEIAAATKPFIEMQKMLHDKYPDGECGTGNFKS